MKNDAYVRFERKWNDTHYTVQQKRQRKRDSRLDIEIPNKWTRRERERKGHTQRDDIRHGVTVKPLYKCLVKFFLRTCVVNRLDRSW